MGKGEAMKYFVTYCVMDQETGANPLWHSALLLSQENSEVNKLEVVETWGFYGLPTTSETNHMSKQLKLKMGLDVDLYGNHGMLCHEQIRFMDLGTGLHGVTFELTEQQYVELQKKCQFMEKEQYEAIGEVVDSQNLQEKTNQPPKIYPHEHLSPLIYELEKVKAKQNGREPRLKPFDLLISLDLWGPHLRGSHTCKSQVISLLSGILSQNQIDRLTVHGKHPTVPRFSGQMETIHLHSQGPLKSHKKLSGNVVYYRDGKNPDVKLYWTIPPQEIEALSEETWKQFEISEDHCDEVKHIVKKLQRLEWLFINAELPERYNRYKQALIQQISSYYQAFSSIEPKKTVEKISGFYGYALGLFSLPRDSHEKVLLQKINQAQLFFNAIYMAIVEQWELKDNVLLNDQDIDLEALASYLKVEDKKAVCALLGRSYCEDEVVVNQVIDQVVSGDHDSLVEERQSVPELH